MPDTPSIAELAQRAKVASRVLATASTTQKDQGLLTAADLLVDRTADVLAANAADVARAEAEGVAPTVIDRLRLTEARVAAMAAGLRQVAGLPDPVGEVLDGWVRPNGLRISRVKVPLGVVAVIYENRPNVTSDAAGLCLKSGNAAILRGGSESAHSARAIMDCLSEGLQASGLPVGCVALVPTQDREAVGILLRMNAYVDVIVPRGGKSLIKRVIEESRIPTFEHLDGNCHTYLHASADPAKALAVTVNAKMRRTGICGATESLVIDRSVASQLLPPLVDFLGELGCEVRGDEEACTIDPRLKPAGDEDWGTEYLDAILSVKLVEGVEEAVDWINRYSSGHTECIVGEDSAAVEAFLDGVDSAIVLHNASTQFADGGEFGMGAEIGIATGRLHARGPVGVEQLTTYKYVVRGQGQTRP
ncbi:MAG: glutamate-5-semialdehyde dehydrogenase [Candidatus Eremiobacteraeota bacterium]|nr:glutamate-5-semialdehyde dehydrogenase [Candidatus Eremiobacteraeota bacterium]